MREELHTVAREKSCAVLNFARFDSLVCIVTRSGEKSRSLSLVQFLARYRSLSLSLTGLFPRLPVLVYASRSCEFRSQRLVSIEVLVFHHLYYIILFLLTAN